MSKKIFLRVVFLLIGISIIHATLPREWLIVHVLFRMLYLLPIIYAALTSGRKGGLATSVTSSFLFLPHFFLFSHATHADMQFFIDNLVAVIVFNITGYGVGAYRDRVESNYAAIQRRSYNPTTDDHEKRILFYLDQGELNLVAAKWLNQFSGGKQETYINLFAVGAVDAENLFESKSAADLHVQQTLASAESALVETKKALMQGGFAEEHIQTSHVKASGRSRFSEKILEELNARHYDFVLVGRHPINKAQEFLVGDAAIHLARNSPVPVVVIKAKAV